jgi:peptidoglycan/LPS O-acetylase OafA/YrhL
MLGNKKVLFGLGAYRLILSWMVIASHTAGYYELFAVDTGAIAVSAFFFISGYLMTLSYENNYAKQGLILGSKKFLMNRFIRIFPVYWTSLIFPIFMALFISALHGKWLGISPSPSFLGWIQNIILIGLNQSLFWGGYERLNNPAWSLDVEFQFYLLVPFMIILYQKQRNATILGLVTLSIGGIFLYFNPVNLVDIDRSFFAWSFFFVAGFFFYKFETSFAKTYKWSIALTLITFLISYEPHLLKSMAIRNFMFSLVFIIISLPFLLIQKEFRFNNFDKVLGDFSYPTYIFHFFVLSISIKLLSFTGLNSRSIITFLSALLINILLTTVVSLFVIRLITDPIEVWRNKVRGKVV